MHICISRGKEFTSATHHIALQILHNTANAWLFSSSWCKNYLVCSLLKLVIAAWWAALLTHGHQFGHTFPFCPTYISSLQGFAMIVGAILILISSIYLSKRRNMWSSKQSAGNHTRAGAILQVPRKFRWIKAFAEGRCYLTYKWILL